MSLEILSAGPMFLRYDSLEQVSGVELRWSKDMIERERGKEGEK